MVNQNIKLLSQNGLLLFKALSHQDNINNTRFSFVMNKAKKTKMKRKWTLDLAQMSFTVINYEISFGKHRPGPSL